MKYLKTFEDLEEDFITGDFIKSNNKVWLVLEGMNQKFNQLKIFYIGRIESIYRGFRKNKYEYFFTLVTIEELQRGLTPILVYPENAYKIITNTEKDAIYKEISNSSFNYEIDYIYKKTKIYLRGQDYQDYMMMKDIKNFNL